MARKYRDDPAWRLPSRHNGWDTLLIIMACGAAALLALALMAGLALIAANAPFRAGEG